MALAPDMEPPPDPYQAIVQTSISDWIACHARFRPAHTAFVSAERRVSWAEFDARVSQVANALLSRGLGKGDKVGLLSPNSIQALEILFGTIRAGGVIVPLSSMLVPDALVALIEDADLKVLFVAEPLAGAIDPIRGRLTRLSGDDFVAIGFSASGFIEYEALVAAQSTERPSVALAHEDDCNIIYSSGTTGVPKGIVHTHLSRAMFTFGLSVQLRFDPSAIALLTTPLFTNGTWMTLLPAVGMGASTVLMQGFSPRKFLELVERERCTHLFMVPTQFAAVLDDPELEARDLSSLRITVSSGSWIAPETKREILQRMTRGLLELYGMTEGIGTVLEPEQMEQKLSSVGRPIGGTEIRIIDELDAEVAAGKPGEIVGYSPGMMRGYHKKPKETEALGWHAPDGRRFIRTGDIGRLDEDGFLYILDRKKDMIISGGVNVYASDLEEVFGRHPDVAEVAAISVPHDKWGETPLILVVPRRDSQPSADAIKTWGNEQLSKHQRASRVELRSELPRNALGKVLKRELREPYWSEQRKA